MFEGAKKCTYDVLMLSKVLICRYAQAYEWGKNKLSLGKKKKEEKEMLGLLYFHNTFTINPKW